MSVIICNIFGAKTGCDAAKIARRSPMYDEMLRNYATGWSMVTTAK